ncbi:putative multi-sensor signal transduction histidine kinase [Desulfuromonas soudanensis]|uniref:histidine kinase n=1 Tax=Desulfuromonas soudanensis TaxID=1603606 RepID=A0A0M5INQ6_9BACT|nr:HAMP domain-containing histidine kinase [Desulfuromonas soudanensis]ALC16761.1 putative multi-sensor signal transduction histidine kinase [Desulfuromonas soudanensis]
MKIRCKLTLSFVAISLLTLVVGVLATRMNSTIADEYDKIVDQTLPVIEALDDLKFAGLRIVSSTSEYLMISMKKDKASGEMTVGQLNEEQELITDGRTAYDRAYSRYESLIECYFAGKSEYLERIRTLGGSLGDLSVRIIRRSKAGADNEEILEIKEVFETAENAYLEAVDALILLEEDELAVRKDRMQGTIETANRTIAVASMITLLLALLGGVSIARSLSQPIVLLRNAAIEVGRGNLDQSVEIGGRDELSDLGRSFNTMTGELRNYSQSVLQMKEYTENILQGMFNALAVVDTSGTIIRVNDAFCRLVGSSEEDLMGSAFSEIAPSCRLDRETGDGGDAQIKNLETAYMSRLGKTIPVIFSCSVLRNSQGVVEARVCVAQDISSLKKVEDDLKLSAAFLEKSHQELQEFIHIASHDLQEPLRKIMTFGSRLAEKYGQALGEQGGDYLARQQSAAERMQTQILDLLTFSRVSSKVETFVSVDLDSILAVVARELKPRLEVMAGELRAEGLGTITGDPEQIRQLFQHLVENALKFRRPEVPPRIDIVREIDDDGRFFRIVVSDNGLGFESRHAERIFGVFQQLHGRGLYAGSGVGLAICRRIAERHGGSLTAQGTPGAGAVFTLILPLTSSLERVA